eukprot:1145561-Pelagomonas_calceolata.AAC.1
MLGKAMNRIYARENSKDQKEEEKPCRNKEHQRALGCSDIAIAFLCQALCKSVSRVARCQSLPQGGVCTIT